MDITQLKMKDLAEVENLSGLTMDEWEKPTAKLTMAIAFVIGKKTNSKLTWADVEDMTVDEMTALAQGVELPKAKNS
jgi:hypothetical protein